MRVLRLHKRLDQFVGGLRVEGQSVVQRQQVGALLQERLLQTHASGMEVLLWQRETVTIYNFCFYLFMLIVMPWQRCIVCSHANKAF